MDCLNCSRIACLPNSSRPADFTPRKSEQNTYDIGYYKRQDTRTNAFTGVDVAKAAVTQAEAQVHSIEEDIRRTTINALVEGRVLQVNIRPGEFVATPSNIPLIVLGNIDQLHVRVDIDEHDIPRFVTGTEAWAMLKGNTKEKFPLTFVRVEPYVVPKRSLTGQNTERVDTRVLQVIYEMDTRGRRMFVGQQVDVYINAEKKNEP